MPEESHAVTVCHVLREGVRLMGDLERAIAGIHGRDHAMCVDVRRAALILHRVERDFSDRLEREHPNVTLIDTER